MAVVRRDLKIDLCVQVLFVMLVINFMKITLKSVALCKGFWIIMPEAGDTFKFKDHAATEMTPFVAFYDCESYLITPVDPSNTLQ